MDSLFIDYAQFHGKPLLLAVDRSSGYIFAAFVRDQSAETAIKFIHQISNKFGWPKHIRSDNGPAFRERLKNETHKYGIEHSTSGPYCPAGNGLVEVGVSCLKTHLHKLGKLDQAQFEYMLYLINNTPSSVEGSGSQFSRFYG